MLFRAIVHWIFKRVCDGGRRHHNSIRGKWESTRTKEREELSTFALSPFPETLVSPLCFDIFVAVSTSRIWRLSCKENFSLFVASRGALWFVIILFGFYCAVGNLGWCCIWSSREGWMRWRWICFLRTTRGFELGRWSRGRWTGKVAPLRR